MFIEAVESAPAFRFIASQVGYAETGIAIIKPTEEVQDVTCVSTQCLQIVGVGLSWSKCGLWSPDTD